MVYGLCTILFRLWGEILLPSKIPRYWLVTEFFSRISCNRNWIPSLVVGKRILRLLTGKRQPNSHVAGHVPGGNQTVMLDVRTNLRNLLTDSSCSNLIGQNECTLGPPNFHVAATWLTHQRVKKFRNNLFRKYSIIGNQIPSSVRWMMLSWKKS
jgi:hypothetical protein